MAENGIIDFNILFDNGHRVHFAGETVKGKILLKLDATLILTCIKLTTIGKSKVQWEENLQEITKFDRGGKRKSIHYDIVKSSEEYLRYDTIIFGDDNEISNLHAGNHEFPFSFQLPNQGLPSSFRGKHGSIKYSIKIEIFRPNVTNIKTRALYTVISPLDLNLFGVSLSRPKIKTKQEDYYSFCCLSGPVNVSISLPVSGVVCGEMLTPTIVIDNKSRAEFNVNLILVECTKYLGKDTLEQEIIKKDRTIITKKLLGNIEARSDRIWLNNQILIPPVPPSTLMPSKNIILNHTLTLSCTSTGVPRRNIIINLPVIIGTVPLNTDTMSTHSSLMPDQPPAYANFLPPSYEEAISYASINNLILGTNGVEEDEDEDEDDLKDVTDSAYKLRYPTL